MVAIEPVGDRESEHAVAEQSKPLVGADSFTGPGRVSQRGAPRLLGQRVDQPAKRFAGAVAAGAPLTRPS